MNTIIWLDTLSLSSVLKLFGIGGRRCEVYFLEKSFFIEYLLAFLNLSGICSINFKKVNYDLGEMSYSTGESIRWQIEGESSDLAVAITQEITELPVCNLISKLIPREKLTLYFEKRIKKEIYPLIRLLCVARWDIKNKNISGCHVFLWKKERIFCCLEKVWTDKNIGLYGYSPIFRKNFYLAYLKQFIKKIIDLYERVFFPRPSVHTRGSFKIGVHYVEGINRQRRSDLCWYYNSGIDPKNLIFIINTDKNARFPLPKSILDEIVAQGIEWVCLDKRAVALKGAKVWKPRGQESAFLIKELNEYNERVVNCSLIEHWTFNALEELIKSVGYWLEFFKEFNIRIYYDIAEGAEILPQSIALELSGGLRIGRQRSEHFWNVTTDLGSHHCDIYFCWNNRQPHYLKLDRSRINYCLISGFPEDRTFGEILKKGYSLKNELLQHGARFVIALFDNACGRDLHFSKDMMEKFYQKFFDLLLNDKEIGIIIKRKKTADLNQFLGISRAFLAARKTGRCIMMEDLYGKLAAEAGFGADISVGIGVSSAVMETVIAGLKGVHCDLSKHRFHPFYKWGYEKIIFDDIDKLILNIKQYKENPQSIFSLGDWSSYINMVEPFRDGKGGERIGNYMKWLLESFHRGQNREEAVHSANVLYAKEWGQDKIYDMRKPVNDSYESCPDFFLNNRIN